MINRQSMLNSSKSSVKIQLLKYVRSSTSNSIESIQWYTTKKLPLQPYSSKL